MDKASLSHLAISGATFKVRAVPRARQNAISYDGAVFKVMTTAAPEQGRATAQVAAALAHVLGVAKSRLTLMQGATARDKVFRLD